MVCISFYAILSIIHGRDLRNRIICFLLYSRPALFGDRDRAEGQREQSVLPPQAAPECNRTMQLLHVGHIIRFPS